MLSGSTAMPSCEFGCVRRPEKREDHVSCSLSRSYLSLNMLRLLGRCSKSSTCACERKSFINILLHASAVPNTKPTSSSWTCSTRHWRPPHLQWTQRPSLRGHSRETRHLAYHCSAYRAASTLVARCPKLPSTHHRWTWRSAIARETLQQSLRAEVES